MFFSSDDFNVLTNIFDENNIIYWTLIPDDDDILIIANPGKSVSLDKVKNMNLLFNNNRLLSSYREYEVSIERNLYYIKCKGKK